MLTFLSTTERIAPLQTKPAGVWQDIADLRHNRPWMLLFVLALVIMVSITLRTSSAAYYFKYYVGRPELIYSFVPAYLLAAAAGTALTPLLTRFIDKKPLMVILMALSALLSSAFYFVHPDQIELMYGLQIALGLVLGPKSPLHFQCMPIRPITTNGNRPTCHCHDLCGGHLLAKARHGGGGGGDWLRLHLPGLCAQCGANIAITVWHPLADVLLFRHCLRPSPWS